MLYQRQAITSLICFAELVSVDHVEMHIHLLFCWLQHVMAWHSVSSKMSRLHCFLVNEKHHVIACFPAQLWQAELVSWCKLLLKLAPCKPGECKPATSASLVNSKMLRATNNFGSLAHWRPNCVN